MKKPEIILVGGGGHCKSCIDVIEAESRFTIKGIIDQDGKLQLLGNIRLPKSRRVIITILDEELSDEVTNLALFSEPALARDWDRPEEDEAWSHLAQLPSL